MARVTTSEQYLAGRTAFQARLDDIRRRGHEEIAEEKRTAVEPLRDELALMKERLLREQELLRLAGTSNGPPVQTQASPSRGAGSHRSPGSRRPAAGWETKSADGRMQSPSETHEVQPGVLLRRRSRGPSASSSQAGDAK